MSHTSTTEHLLELLDEVNGRVEHLSGAGLAVAAADLERLLRRTNLLLEGSAR